MTVEEHMLDWLDGMVELFAEDDGGSRRVAGPRKSGREVFLCDDLQLDLDDDCLMESFDQSDLKQAGSENTIEFGPRDKACASRAINDTVEKISRDLKPEHAHIDDDDAISDDGSPKKRRRVHAASFDIKDSK
ncbi:hypothetical protein BGZ72_002043 [Mortierella alpina]|nr:hypothetical protein BGZ72_002043 [Mortierella alpina]